MPRHQAIDYPPVPHRPAQTIQPQLGLAPPPSFAIDNRFSFQETPIEAVSPDADQLFDIANAARRQQQRQSRVPPLPILPEHLSDGQTHFPQQAVLPSQRRDFALVQAQQDEQQRQAQNRIAGQEAAVQFRPDMPRHYQQLQEQQQLRPQPHLHHQSPAPTYEQSQVMYQDSPQYPLRTQEQPVYPGPYVGQNVQLPVHTLPLHNVPILVIQTPQQSAEDKAPLSADMHQQNIPQQPRPVHIGPDENPLLPASPRSTTSPTTTTTNIRPLPTSTSMTFTQSSSYAPQQPERGGTWHHSLYSCSLPTICLSSLFCPCLIYGRTQHRLSLKSAGKDPTNMLSYSSINGSCLAWAVLPGVNALLTAIQHRRVRKVYDMEGKGDFVGDCVRGVCCCCCMLAQDEKEMREREMSVATKAAGIEGYKGVEEMRFAPSGK